MILSYKSIRSEVRYSGEDDVYHGKLMGTDDLVTWESDSIGGCEKAFIDAVESYLALKEQAE